MRSQQTDVENKKSTDLVEFFWPAVSTLVLFGSLFALVMGKFFDGLADDPGVGWHFKAGQIISETGIIPHLDPFLGWPERAAWVCDQWLGDLIFYSIYKYGGWPLVYGFVGAWFFLYYFLILFPYSKRFAHSTIGVAIGLYFACKLATIQLLVRSTIFGIMFFGITLLVALHARRDLLSQNKIPAKYFVGLPLLFLFWANIHPSFFLGFILLGVFLFSFFLDRFIYDASVTDKTYLSWGGLIVVCVLVTLINPVGYELHKSIIELGQSDFFMNYHMEWKSVDFKAPAGEFLYFLLAIIGAGWYFNENKRTSTWQILGLLVFGYLALRSVRLVPHLAIFCIIPCADAVAALWKGGLSKLPIFSGLTDPIFVRAEKQSWFCTFAASMLVLAFIATPLYTGTFPLKTTYFGPYKKAFPYEGLKYLDTSERAPIIVLNDPNWGGFITFYSESGHKPLFDDRNSVMGEARTKAWQAFYERGEKAEEYIASINPKYLMVDPSRTGTKILKALKRYPIVFEDEVAVIFKVN